MVAVKADSSFGGSVSSSLSSIQKNKQQNDGYRGEFHWSFHFLQFGTEHYLLD